MIISFQRLVRSATQWLISSPLPFSLIMWLTRSLRQNKTKKTVGWFSESQEKDAYHCIEIVTEIVRYLTQLAQTLIKPSAAFLKGIYLNSFFWLSNFYFVLGLYKTITIYLSRIAQGATNNKTRQTRSSLCQLRLIYRNSICFFVEGNLFGELIYHQKVTCDSVQTVEDDLEWNSGKKIPVILWLNCLLTMKCISGAEQSDCEKKHPVNGHVESQ